MTKKQAKEKFKKVICDAIEITQELIGEGHLSPDPDASLDENLKIVRKMRNEVFNDMDRLIDEHWVSPDEPENQSPPE